MPSAQSDTSSHPTKLSDGEEAMARLRQVRDEIRLHIHLAGMEAKTRFGTLEGDFKQLEDAAHTMGDGAKAVVQSLMQGFSDLRDSLKDSPH